MMRQVQALLSTSSPLAPQPSAPNSWLCPHSGHHLLVPQPRTPRFLRYCQQHTRREVVIGGSSVLPLLLSTHFQSIGQAHAEDDDQNASPTTSNLATDQNASPATSNLATEEDTPMNKKNICERMITAKAFFDVSIDREPAGRIIVGLYGESVPIGATRFASLLSGTAGISYRRKEFIKIMPNYIQHGGIRSYGVDADLAKMTGSNLIADELLSEWEMYNKNCNGTKNVAGSLGIIIRDPLKPPPKLKLVARKGKLEIDEEEVRTDPNGTEFVISTKDSPEIDASTLVVGEVLVGMDVVEKISKVKTVQENTSSPYFRVAKLIGDKRAVVAERGFNRPYSKVVITNCGLMN